MSEKVAAAETTKVTGYYNPNSWQIALEISEANLKCVLNPGQYIRDRDRQLINDPIFEQFVRPKGLARATGEDQVPVRYVPRILKTARPAHSVTQATAFVRQPDGAVIPAYATDPTVQGPEVAVNANPVVGMTVEAARAMGLIGKPRILSEDYGAQETTGAPASTKDLPSMKYSLESPPRLKTAAPLSPELMQADPRLTPAQMIQRATIQQGLARAAAGSSPDVFDPASMRPATPVPLRAPKTPTRMTPSGTVAPPPPPSEVAQVADVVDESEEAEVPPEAVEGGAEEGEATGFLTPMDEDSLPGPTLDPPADTDEGRRFICAADGKSFKFRSELERHVKRKFPKMVEALMRPYPPEG
jgi:hypothetical protein